MTGLSILKHADLFEPRTRIVQPPGADWYVLMSGSCVLAQGSMDTIRLNEGFRYVAP